MIEIIPRARWGARFAAGFGEAPVPAARVWLHHSETASAGARAPLDADIATVQALEWIGQERFGGGISYSWAVTEAGRVFEGAGARRRGSHTKGDNTHGRGIVLLGGYMTREPTLAQLQAVPELLAHGARAGWWELPELAGGHRDAPGAATACPGDRAYARIREINTRAAQLWAQGGDDMFTDDDRARLAKLDRVHDELTKLLPNRRGAAGRTIPNGGKDTALGYAANGDGFGFRAEAVLGSLLLAQQDTNRQLRELAARIERMENR
jgi:hypothetical protein